MLFIQQHILSLDDVPLFLAELGIVEVSRVTLEGLIKVLELFTYLAGISLQLFNRLSMEEVRERLSRKDLGNDGSQRRIVVWLEGVEALH
jgi:hypothetical protein